MTSLDSTHDPNRISWVDSANGHPEFPIQNLPFGVFSTLSGVRRGGVAIGEEIFDIAAAAASGVFEGEALIAAKAAAGGTLNPLMALPSTARKAFRHQLSDLLKADGPGKDLIGSRRSIFLRKRSECVMHLPAIVGDFTDFFAGIHHASSAGRLFRGPDKPLLPNYKYVPVGYHGRASSIRVSGESVRRPNGQRIVQGAEKPEFGPSRKLDYELELGLWVGAGNRMGEPIPIGCAREHIVGLCLLNDWSARDIQAWEAQPLGPFLAKNFSTSISPWVITVEALAPFRVAPAPRPPSDPAPLDYLSDEDDQRSGALNCALEVFLLTPGLAALDYPAHRLSRSNATYLYWTFAQMIAHHTSGGCNLQPGDLIGSGTISGEGSESGGALLEISEDGKKPIHLPSGEVRSFLEDGDEVIFRARCSREGFVSIGFGECIARVDA